MADIKQAAKWLQEGKDVQRSSLAGKYWLSPWYPLHKLMFQVVCADGGKHELDCFDLQAEDWEPVL